MSGRRIETDLRRGRSKRRIPTAATVSQLRSQGASKKIKETKNPTALTKKQLLTMKGIVTECTTR
jgi:hypothetical protein